MSNFTVASTTFASVVLAGAAVLAVIMWRSAHRVADLRLRWIAAAFLLLALKSAVSIYSIQVAAWHHDVSEMIDSGFDVAIVGFMMAPIWLRR